MLSHNDTNMRILLSFCQKRVPKVQKTALVYRMRLKRKKRQKVELTKRKQNESEQSNNATGILTNLIIFAYN